MTNRCSLRLLAVNVGQPQILGEQNGEILLSAIAKKPVSASIIGVGHINLDGDAQANLEKHGGPDKAVYAYSADNWTWWDDTHGLGCRPGAFGENVTLADEFVEGARTHPCCQRSGGTGEPVYRWGGIRRRLLAE